MRNKTLIKINFSVNKLIFDFNIFTNKINTKEGILYTLFSDKKDLLEVGFAENNRILDQKLSGKELILLDKKKGNKLFLNLLEETLFELGIKKIDDKVYKYSETTIRHLDTLGWPIGKSLYKKRVIKKELSYI